MRERDSRSRCGSLEQSKAMTDPPKTTARPSLRVVENENLPHQPTRLYLGTRNGVTRKFPTYAAAVRYEFGMKANTNG
jgi:hypothetical protein